ncbi:MAG TPA: hypothetical protein DIT99_31695 [Candidatus Latescibacteria bacterium]|jgi:histidinol-phosphate aminotransferase|nr:hypothetical protein [Candidatus Latescibacterota bacterium]
MTSHPAGTIDQQSGVIMTSAYEELLWASEDEPVSRRTFLSGALLGGAGLLAGLHSKEAVANALAGRRPSQVQGIGVPKGLVRLAFNENPVGASPKAIEAVMAHQDWMNRYDYTTTLQKALIRFHKLDIPRPSGFDFKAVGDQHGLILGVGTTELLQLLALEAFMGHGETIEALPSYGQITRVGDELREAGYPVLARRVPVTPDGNHDLEAMRQLITDRTGLIIICNPHNPTGSLLPHQDVIDFIDQVPPHVLVTVDEIYIHFVRDPAYQDFMELAKERENVLVLRTFSKAHGLGGMRVGYGIGHHKIIKRLAPFSMGLLGRNNLSVHAAAAAVDDTDHIQRSQQVVWEGNDYLSKELQKLGTSVLPSHANFLWADFGRETRRIVRELWTKKVMVRAGAGAWESPNHIRVSTGSKAENEAFIWTLDQILA